MESINNTFINGEECEKKDSNKSDILSESYRLFNTILLFVLKLS